MATLLTVDRPLPPSSGISALLSACSEEPGAYRNRAFFADKPWASQLDGDEQNRPILSIRVVMPWTPPPEANPCNVTFPPKTGEGPARPRLGRVTTPITDFQHAVPPSLFIQRNRISLLGMQPVCRRHCLVRMLNAAHRQYHVSCRKPRNVAIHRDDIWFKP